MLTLAPAALLAACGSVAPPAPPAPPTAAAARTPASATAAASPPPVTGAPAASDATATPPPTLGGVRYFVPPGWQVSTPSAGEADLVAESGLTIVLRAAPGASPAVTATTGRPVAVDGSGGFETAGPDAGPDAGPGTGAGAGAAGYDVHASVVHGSEVYDLRCHSPDRGDSQSVQDICDGFVQGLHWTG